MGDIKLKPCPLCGSNKVEMLQDYSRIEQRYFYHIFCNNCDWGFTPQSLWSEEDIINKWNTRY